MLHANMELTAITNCYLPILDNNYSSKRGDHRNSDQNNYQNMNIFKDSK